MLSHPTPDAPTYRNRKPRSGIELWVVVVGAPQVV
jgi:hypothetical protein